MMLWNVTDLLWVEKTTRFILTIDLMMKKICGSVHSDTKNSGEQRQEKTKLPSPSSKIIGGILSFGGNSNMLWDNTTQKKISIRFQDRNWRSKLCWQPLNHQVLLP
jgi:hypothetical protein